MSTFRGQVLVSVREFYTKDGEELPGRKGIALTEEQWNSLLSQVDDINHAILEKKESLKNK